MLSKRKSLNDDLIIWHGMSVHNISIAVTSGLPLEVRRRKIWLDVLTAEVEKKSKSIVAQNFVFSARGNLANFSALNDAVVSEEDLSFVSIPMEVRVDEIVDSLSKNLPIRVDQYNSPIINYLATIIASEMKENKEATKILSFLLYREQIRSNRRPCIPTGAEAFHINHDIIESCINNKAPNVYKHMLMLEVDRDIVWKLFEVCLSELLPLVLRVRFIDLALVKGCVVFVSVMLAYIGWRQETFLRASSAAEFIALLKDKHKLWVNDNELETFWQKCIDAHDYAFLTSYIHTASLMRLKSITMAKQRESTASLLRQFQQEIFNIHSYSWIGFDVDHTLVEYKLPYLLNVSFEQAAKELQHSFIGLRTMARAVWLPEIAQRGVAIDTSRGNFLHVTEEGTILRAYHGSHEMSYFSISLLYGDYNSQDLTISSSKMIYLYTAADIIFAPLYAWIVDAFDSGAIVTEELGASLYLVPDIEDTEQDNPNDPFLANQLAYISLSTFTLRAAKTYYANGFWKTICSNPELLIQPNPDIRSVLEMLKGDETKKLFILTNGSWTHCNEVMKFAVGKDWLTLFDIVLTEAKKDIFFDELNDTSFSEIDPESSCPLQKRIVRTLEKNKIYAHGNLQGLMEFIKRHRQPNGPRADFLEKQRICYFGDHIVQDTLLPSKHTKSWDLVAIIKEIQNLYQPTERDERMPPVLSWFGWLFSRETVRVSPDVYSPFFFLGMNGSASHFGKKVCAAATICLPSVGKLARHEGTVKVSMIQHGLGRYSTSSELKTLSKRVSAKVRSMKKKQSQ
uniref:Rab-GAP TBC domain-containing protein n=1 Tax=Globisporangium ultimum (strain ATCC 200006 / CBS 805.95 / DAOM BR144) TaxID=431595 RepID=K3X5R9_GLOUD